MPNRHRQFRVRHLLVVLFLSSLIFCLWANYVPFTTLQARWGEVATAQSPNASLLVQQGIERYRTGDAPGAIASWQTALNAYQSTNNLANAAIVRGKTQKRSRFYAVLLRLMRIAFKVKAVLCKLPENLAIALEKLLLWEVWEKRIVSGENMTKPLKL
jgi:hypothetical protein